MGINERRYAWMDEGWATNFPFDLNPATDSTTGARESNAKGYAQIAGTSMDVPLIMQSCQMNGQTYRNASYNKPACMYDIFRDMVGSEQFIKALKYYVATWNGKHPQPYDFVNCMNTALGSNFDWYWHPWLVEFAYPDLGITGVTLGKSVAHINVQNNGKIPLPVDITIIYEDGTKQHNYFSAAVWEKQTQAVIDIPCSSDGKIKRIILGNKKIPDTDKANNIWEIN
jgi:aminopeptidase N